MSEWRAIPGWEGFYEASDCGNVRSVDRVACNGRRISGRVLRPKTNNRGYLCVNLLASPRRQMVTVHRMVASAFIPNQGGLPQVNHKDGVKANCAAINLEWSSASENSIHSTANRLNPIARLTDDQIGDIRYRHGRGIAIRQLAREYELDRACIRRIVQRKAYAWVS